MNLSKKLDWCAHAILSLILFFLPFAFGGVQNWSLEIFYALTTALVGVALLRSALDPSIRIRWTWAYLSILLFVLLAVCQLISWPTSFVSVVSPHTAELRGSLIGITPHQTLSLYPLVTVENLRLVLSVSGIFFSVLQIYRAPGQIEQLLLTIAWVGFAVSLLAVFQNLTGATTVYGIIPAPHRNSGPFMNYSHFSQFMNLSLGATIGLALLRGISVANKNRLQLDSFEQVQRLLSRRDMRLVKFLVAAGVIESITIFLSMSRVGAVSLIVAAAVTGALLSWRTRSKEKGSLVLIFGIVVLAILLCVGFDSIYNHLATLRHLQSADGGRLQMLRDMYSEFKLFPTVGTGLGTHEYVFPMFDHSGIRELATYSENEFAQLLEEAGIPGLLLALYFVSIISIYYVRCIRTPQQPIQYAAFGLGFGLLAILIHSCTDFGQHVTANAVLTACSCAMLVNIARLQTKPADSVHPSPNAIRLRTLIRFASLFIVMTLGLWCTTSTDAARIADDTWDATLQQAVALRDANWQGSDDQYIALLTSAKLATQLQPGNVKYRYWLDMYRWRSLERNAAKSEKTMVLQQAALSFVSQIISDLHVAQHLCPTFGPSFSLAGELQYFVLSDKKGMDEVSIGARLDPRDPVAEMNVGQYALEAHRWDQAESAFQNAVRAGADKAQIVTLCVSLANQPDLACQIAQNDLGALRTLVDVLHDRPQDKAIIAQCNRDITRLLQTAADQPDSPPEAIAAVAAQYAADGDNPNAILYYRKALALDYAQVNWHYQLASVLGASGDVQGGMNEARVCLRIRPQMKEAQMLLGNLSVQSPASKPSSP